MLQIFEIHIAFLACFKAYFTMYVFFSFFKRKITFYLFRISAMKEKTLKSEKDVSQQMKNFKTILDEKDKLLLKLEVLLYHYIYLAFFTSLYFIHCTRLFP